MNCEPSRQPIEVRQKVKRFIVSTSLLVSHHRCLFERSHYWALTRWTPFTAADGGLLSVKTFEIH